MHWFREHRYGTVLGILVAAVFLSAGEDPPDFLSPSGKDCYSNVLAVTCYACPELACIAATVYDYLFSNTFEPNLGQADPTFEFVSQNGRASLLLSGGNAALKVPDGFLRLTLEGARRSAPQALEPQVERVNYFIGNRPDKWIRDVPTFGKVRYPQVYPGIDVVYYGNGGTEHDFVVAPGADPAAIRLRFTGASHMRGTSEGDLEFKVGSTTVRWKKPVLYQKMATGRKRPVEGRYRMDADGAIGFETGRYDVSLPLVIDPPIAFATYHGRGGADSAARVAVDAAGNAYYTGGTNDLVFPFTAGAVAGNSSTAASGDVIVTKASADGKTILYTTHLGGVGTDIGLGIAVDASGNILVAGGTQGFDFPVTRQVQTTPPGKDSRSQCFVLKLNAAGNSLLYSTLLGGSTGDICTSIGLDSAGNSYVAGTTASRDFPTKNGFQSNPRIGNTPTTSLDGFVAKLSPDGSNILYSTFFGGNGNDAALGIAVDPAGNAYVTGGTTSENFGIAAGAFQNTFGGLGTQNNSQFDSGDAFVLKLSPTGERVYSTYLGGSKDDLGIGIAIDAQGNAYVGGSTLSPNFPLQGAFQTAYGGSGGEPNYFSGDGFIAKLNPTGTALLYSSYLGGKGDDRVAGVAVDPAGNAYIAGNTLSDNFRVTADAAQKTPQGQSKAYFRTGDAFFAQIGPAGALVYSSFLGGTGSDFATGVAIDASGGILVVGGTDSSDFPTTTGAAQPVFGGADKAFLPAGDAFLVRYGTLPSVSISAVQNAASYSSGSVSPGEIVVLRGVSIGPKELVGLQLNTNGTVATTVSTTRILFDDVPAPIVYVSAAQSAVVVPYSVATRASTNVVVEFNGNRSAPVAVPVTAAVPGLFSADSSGIGQAALFNQDNSYNSPQNPAAKGSIIQLYGTGEGQTNPPGVEGRLNAAVFPKPVLPVAVVIGGTRIEAAALPYYGAAPQAISGLFQVNVTIPPGTASGSVPVQLIVGTATSQAGLTISVR